MLPGVAYLEMAREAVRQALGDVTINIQLKSVVWARPIIVDDKPKTVHIGVVPEENGNISYKIYTEEGNTETNVIVHSQGIAVIGNSQLKSVANLDIQTLQLTHNRKELSSAECYEVFSRMGIAYGPGHKGVEKIYVGEDSVLAKLNLPTLVIDSLREFEMHPSLMDSALQTSIGMMLGKETTSEKPMLPFALSSLEVFSPCTARMWVFIKQSQEQINAGVQKLDIKLCDEEGKVCVIMRGFSSRILEGELSSQKQSLLVANKLISLAPIWEGVKIESISNKPDLSSNVTIIGGNKTQQESIQSKFSHSRCITINSDDSIQKISQIIKTRPIHHLIWISPETSLHSIINDDLINHQHSGVLLLFKLLKALLTLGYGAKPLSLTVITFHAQFISKNDRVDPTHAGLHGLIGSLAKEYPNWKVKLLDLELHSEFPLETILTLPSDSEGNALVYRNKEWFKQTLIPISSSSMPLPDNTTYRQGGVYVVIGGAGGIGEVWTKWMIKHYQAHVIWIGRREKNSDIQAKIDSFKTDHSLPEYIQADATNLDSLQKAYNIIKSQHSQINGVIHSAIILSDASIATMTEEQFKNSLSAKVDICVRIIQVCEKEALDFILFFSSMQSFIKAPGQGNYAAGCVFKDVFAKAISNATKCKVKVMNWGYWGSVGVVANSFYQDRMEKVGIGSIEPEEGMEAIQQLMESPLDQVCFIKTTKSEGISINKQMTVYSKIIPSVIEKVTEVMTQNETSFDRIINSMENEEIDAVKALSLRILVAILRSLDLVNSKANSSLLTSLPNFYHLWLKESLLLIQKEKLRLDQPFYLDVLWQEWDEKKQIWINDSNKKSQIILIDTCLRALPNILTKKWLATDVMFPNSSMQLVEGIYKDNSVSDLFNEILAQTIVAYLQQRIDNNPNARVRLLEIGAGTGGTTEGLLPKLIPFQDHIDQYLYTDLSKAFLLHAENKFVKDYPYVVPQLFDVTKPLLGQGINPDSYDVVIATNVLHATPSIRETLQNAKATLHRSGIIVINEISNQTWFAHLTFGLLEGWWLSQDQALRIPGSPGLYPETWKRVLEEEGFGPVIFPAKALHHLGQQIIVTQSDGLVKQHVDLPLEKPAQHSASSISKITETSPSRKDHHAFSPDSEVFSHRLEEHVRTHIRASLTESLKIEERNLSDDEIFSDYGIDSILGVQLVNIINKKMDIELQTTVLFDYSTVERLSKHIIKNYGPSLKIAGAGSIIQATDNRSHSSSVQMKQRRFFPSEKAEQQRAKIGSLTHLTENKEVKNSSKAVAQDEIAIIGLSGRFAESDTIDAFWEHLVEGDDLVKESSRWDLSSHYEKDAAFCHHGSFLDNIDQFDPMFFKISELEATYMDPQQRLFLEESWKALEDAGYVGELIDEMKCGIYVGCSNGDYSHLLSEQAPAHSFWGNAGSVIPARISYYLNLHGPAIAVDTACSSSLVAVHLACQGLWTRETDMALAGGVFIQSTPAFYMAANKAKMLSSTGKCHTFDEAADGFVPGEGVGVIVLKRLEDALVDGDHIYGVIRGSGINQDGTTNGITAPSPKSQELLECEVYNRFHIHPEEIQVIEAHGTGTNLGDPIEYEALSKAFRHYTDKKQYCAIGSVKTNIGHSGTAAGISGMIKILLSLQHKKIPPSLHYNKGNAKINFQDSPFYVNTSAKSWDTSNGEPRCAAISSFGFSGTNAHIVIQEAPPVQRTHKENPGYLIVFSAQTFDQLALQVKNLLQFCKNKNGIDLGNLSYTLLTGRKQLNHRWGCVVKNNEELINRLNKWLDKDSVEQVYTFALEGKQSTRKVSLKKYGDQCIESCQNTHDATDYLEHLSAICDLVVQGYKLDIKNLFGEGYSRITLPTYPFAKGRYWVDTTSSTKIYSEELKQPATSPPNLESKSFGWDFSIPSSTHPLNLEAAVSRLKDGNSSLGNIEKVTLFLKQKVADQLQQSVNKIDSNSRFFGYGDNIHWHCPNSPCHQ